MTDEIHVIVFSAGVVVDPAHAVDETQRTRIVEECVAKMREVDGVQHIVPTPPPVRPATRTSWPDVALLGGLWILLAVALVTVAELASVTLTIVTLALIGLVGPFVGQYIYHHSRKPA